MLNWKEYGTRRSWPNLNIPALTWRDRRKPRKFSHDDPCPYRNSDWGPTKYTTGASPLEPTGSALPVPPPQKENIYRSLLKAKSQL
jgi:hypothetical protein